MQFAQGCFPTFENMEVFKFGGASVKDAEGVRNVNRVLQLHKNRPLVVVVSAMGKTTNALEAVVNAYVSGESYTSSVQVIKDYHQKLCGELIPDKTNAIYPTIETIFSYLERYLEQSYKGDRDQVYDQIVPTGELLSTKIISHFLAAEGFENEWIDIRRYLKTDDYFGAAHVDWAATEEAFEGVISDAVYITQGFIGGTRDKLMTTLGREGSDYTASILASVLDAEKVTIWKDVPGVLNADPKFFNNTFKLEHISYREAVELAFYGATVIHPKTIRPLQNKNIPLCVRSFYDLDEEGTLINKEGEGDKLVPSYIFRPDQVLLSFSPKDFAFIAEHQISEIFSILAKKKFVVSLMQNSAINFSVVVPNNESRLQELVEELQENYLVRYNTDLELLTVRHFDGKILEELINGRDILLEQRTRNTVRVLLKQDE